MVLQPQHKNWGETRNLSLLVIPISVLAGCESFSSQPVPAPTSFSASAQDSNSGGLTQQQCESNSQFAWVPEGPFIAGSDQVERDAGYQVSAEGWAIAYGQGNNTSDDIAQTEQRLRQQRWFDTEPDQEERSLPGFCMQQNLVTNADYLKFITATGHRAPGISESDYQTQGFLVHPYSDVEPYLWQERSYPAGKAQHPVVLVSYTDALAYADWRGHEEGVSYRLATALEWEKAARGNDGHYFPWGNTWRNEATNWIGSGLNGTSEIATFPLSQSMYGIEDMAGNVFEFTSTLLERRGQQVSVMKGCSWDDLPGFCRSAYRHIRPIESRHILFGFRIVRKR